MSIITTTESNVSAPAHSTAPKFHRWRVRKEWPEGGYSCCEYNSPINVERVKEARRRIAEAISPNTKASQPGRTDNE